MILASGSRNLSRISSRTVLADRPSRPWRGRRVFRRHTIAKEMLVSRSTMAPDQF